MKEVINFIKAKNIEELILDDEKINFEELKIITE